MIKINLPKKSLFFLAPIFILYILNAIFGFYFKYSFGWYVNELISFTIFYFFIIIIIGFSKEQRTNVLQVLAHYVIYFYPALTLVSIITAGEENLFFDEFEKFYFISIIPILFLKIPRKFLIILLHIVVFSLKAKYTYTSSLNILFIAISVVMLFFIIKISLIKKVGFVVLVFLGAFIVYQTSSKLTKFKIYQAQTAIPKMFEGDVSSIPKSPRVRAVEFIISFENLKQAGMIFQLIGKGYGSYIDDNETNFFKKYKIRLKEEDYSEVETKLQHYKKGHGGISYIPIKMGIVGLVLFLIFCIMSFFVLIKYKNLKWLAISAPFYIITTFSYGMKNFIFVGVVIGLVLSINYKYPNEKRTSIY
ncbi:hypothetical protein, partial [Aquimarina sp. AD1]